MPTNVIKDILTRLSFGVEICGDDITAIIPPWRDDVEDYPDLSEEIIRMYGYGHIVNTLLKDASITVGGLNKEQKEE